MKSVPERPISSALYNELADQRDNPPGNDPSLGCFYGAVVGMVDDSYYPMVSLINETALLRPDITNKHFVNLLFRAVQSIKLEEGNLAYRVYEKPEQWHEDLSRMTEDARPRETLQEILRHRSTTTTIYQRYAGPYIAIAHLFDGKPAMVADLGCGGNYGLRGMEIHEPFKPIDDSTPGKLASSSLLHRIQLERGLAIDKDDPDDPQVTAWRLACSFYPKELDQLPGIKRFEKRLRGSQRVQFIRADLLTFGWLPTEVVDVAIISTTLYQLDAPGQQKFTDQAKHLLRPDGVLLVQDFAQKDPNDPFHLNFDPSWFGEKYSYRLFIATRQLGWAFLEALQWNNGRCTTVRPGEDYSEVFSRPRLISFYPSSSANAALAH